MAHKQVSRRSFLGGAVAAILGGTVCSQASDQSHPRHPIWRDPNREAPMKSIYHVFRSEVVEGPVSCLVWLPPAYQRQAGARFPVIYWLHGANGNQRKCFDTFMPEYIKALRDRAAPPAIVVAINGIPLSFYGDAIDGTCPVESVIIKDLIPNIDRSFRTIATREGRLIEGFSMGGFGAAHLGLKYPDVFGAIAINSGGPLPGPDEIVPTLRDVYGDHLEELPVQLAKRNADQLRGRTLIRITCGTNDRLLEGNRQLSQTLDELQIPHRMVEIPGVGHEGGKLYERLGKRGFLFHRRAFGDRSQPDE